MPSRVLTQPAEKASPPRRILVIEDEEPIAWSLRRAFERTGFRVSTSASAEEGLELATRYEPDVVLLDVRLPGMDGLRALAELRQRRPEAAVIVMTAHGNLETAVQAVAGGAFDYLAKPFDLAEAVDAVERAIRRQARSVPAAEAGGEPTGEADLSPPDAIIGRSPAMQAVFKRIARVAPTHACVMITGESGTGKELVARAIHANSPRKDHIFLPVHVAALNPNLVESELFGHVKGAFTGATQSRPGLLSLADGGTVFLDELADIPLPVQAKLLRVLERQEVLPVGGVSPQLVNVRIVSATHAALADAVREQRFRADLYFRLNVYPIHLPPLRDRGEDVIELALHFLKRFGVVEPALALGEETRAYLRSRAWPGNVRELRNALEHAAIEASGGPLKPEHFPPPMDLAGAESLAQRLRATVRQWADQRIRASHSAEPVDLYQQLLEEVEPALLDEVLAQVEGNRLVASRWLGLARATVRKMLRKYRPDVPDEPDEG